MLLAPLLVATIAMAPEAERVVVEAARARLGTPYVLGARTKDGSCGPATCCTSWDPP